MSYEIIVVDNASHEKSTSFKELFPTILFIQNQENFGFAKGNNIGINKAAGKYILLLNSDATLGNDAISITKEFLDQNKNTGIVTGRLEYPDGKIQHNCQRFPSIRYQMAELLRLQKIFPSVKRALFGPFFDYDSVAFPDWVWGTFFMFRRELLGQLPGKKLADDFFMYVEDMQWCMEFKKLGYKTAFTPEARIIHFMGKSKGNKNDLIFENTRTFMKKYYTPWERVLINILDRLLKH